jgi:hypothetical protein
MRTPIKKQVDLPQQTANTDWVIELRILEDGEPIADILDIKFALKPKKGTENVMDLDLNEGLTYTDGVLRIERTAEETDLNPETYLYDLRLERDSGNFVYVKGSLVVDENITAP